MTDSPAPVLRFEVSDRVAVLTLNRPESLNALNRELSSAIADAFRRVRDDDEIRVAVLTGEGRAFCAGADLKERASGSSQMSAGPGSFLAPSNTVDAGKPIIAALNGFCLAGGLELALRCDMRFGAESAQLGLTEITHGFFPGGGGPQRFMRQLPHAIALDLLLTGDKIDAQTALGMGLVSRIFPDDELLPKTMEVAKQIASYAPLAVQALREVAYAAPDLPLDQALRFGSSLRWIIAQTEDAKEGPRAFSEKRQANYRGE